MSTLGIENIEHTNGTSAMTINSSGVVTTGVKHAFYMYRSANQSISHGAGPTIIQFDASRIDEGGGVTLGSSAKYTVPSGAGGIYVLNGHGRMNTGSDGNVSIGIWVNGSGIVTSYYENNYYEGMNCSSLRSLSEGDYVELRISNSIGSSVNVGGDDQGDNTFLWGYRLG
tara:strand:- start:1372 stop:1881 length:510 start_codon:yes stop_codon:yes gene_type:complete